MSNAIYRAYETSIKYSETIDELEEVYKDSKSVDFSWKWELRLYDLYLKRKSELEERE